ncbi:MAG: hypothetical protein VKL41_08455 [Snowella sp.]|nr:hypothetical protein [Snowella sp.]
MQSSFPIVFKNGQTAQVLTVEPEQDLASALVAVSLTESRPVLVAIGGASLISEEHLQRLQRLFSEVLAPLAQELGLIVVDSGTDAGVVRLIGNAREEISGSFPLVGVSPVGLVKLSNQDLRKSDNERRIFKLLTKIVIEQAVLKLINSLSSQSSKSIESNPDQQGTTDVIALNTSLTTLATF